MRIVCVCGFGIGSSVIAKMNIEGILADEGHNDWEVETVDLGSVQGTPADLYVTTHEMFDQFPEDCKENTLVLDSFVDVDAIKEALDARLG